MKKLRSACEKNGRFFEELIRRWLHGEPPSNHGAPRSRRGAAEREEKGRAIRAPGLPFGHGPEKGTKSRRKPCGSARFRTPPIRRRSWLPSPYSGWRTWTAGERPFPFPFSGRRPLLLFHDIETNGICYVDLASTSPCCPTTSFPSSPFRAGPSGERGRRRRTKSAFPRESAGRRGGSTRPSSPPGNGRARARSSVSSSAGKRWRSGFPTFSPSSGNPHHPAARQPRTVREDGPGTEGADGAEHRSFGTPVRQHRLRSFFSRSGFVRGADGGLGQLLFLMDRPGKWRRTGPPSTER
jgi:hypothetical protein